MGSYPPGGAFLVFKLDLGWVAYLLGLLSPLAWLLPAGGFPGFHAPGNFLVASPLAAPKIARFANWRFDLATFSLVSPTGVETTLSQAEGQLLTVLLEHANQILSRDQLLDGRDVCALDRSIDLRISRRRRRLDENPQHAKLIKTVYGAGYLLAATVDWQ